MAVFFWYLVGSDLPVYACPLYSSLHWTGHFLQGTNTAMFTWSGCWINMIIDQLPDCWLPTIIQIWIAPFPLLSLARLCLIAPFPLLSLVRLRLTSCVGIYAYTKREGGDSYTGHTEWEGLKNTGQAIYFYYSLLYVADMEDIIINYKLKCMYCMCIVYR